MSVASIYKQIINDVIENVKEDFQREGVSEAVLFELKRLWETKLLQSGVTSSTYIPNEEDNSNQDYIDPILRQSLQTLSNNAKQNEYNQDIPQTIDNNFGKPQEYITMVNQQEEAEEIVEWSGEKRKRNEQVNEVEEVQNKKIKIQEIVEDEEDEEDDFVQVDGMISIDNIPQLDGGINEGGDIDGDDLDSNDDENELNSDDDEQIPQTNDIILAQFEKFKMWNMFIWWKRLYF
eukprot:gene363-6777_t